MTALGDYMTDVPTRADDDFAAVVTSRGGATPAAQTQQVGVSCRDADVHAPSFRKTEGCQSTCQAGKLFEVSTASRDRETRLWKEAGLLREKALEKKRTARRMEEQKNKAFRGPPRRHCPRSNR